MQIAEFDRVQKVFVHEAGVKLRTKTHWHIFEVVHGKLGFLETIERKDIGPKLKAAKLPGIDD